MTLSPRLKKSFIIAGLSLLTFFSLLIIVSKLFGDSITKLVIEQINTSINAEISVGKVDFSVFRRFPNAAVVFTDVKIKNPRDFQFAASNTGQPLLIKAKSVFVEMNIFKLLFKNYAIKRIMAENGEINLLINKKGDQNFDIFKNDGKEKSGSKIDFNNLGLKNFRYSYTDLKHQIELKGIANKFNLRGRLTEGVSKFTISGDLYSHSFQVQKIEYYKNKAVQTELILQRTNEIYALETSSLQLEGMDVELKMLFNNGSTANIDLKASSSGDLSHIQKLVPDTYLKYTQSFQSKGKVDFDVIVYGRTYNNFFPHVEVNFEINKGTIIQTKSRVKLHNIKCSGNYTNGKGNKPETSVFTIKNLSGGLSGGTISGNFSYSNFSRPEIGIKFKTIIDLAEIQKFIEVDTIETISGKLNADINFNASFKNASSYSRENIQKFNISGNTVIKEAQVKIKNSNYTFSNINSEITLGNDFIFDNLSLLIDNNDFFIRGKLVDAVPYLLHQNNSLNLEAELRSQNLDLSKYFEKNPKKRSTDKYNASVLFPQNLQATLNVSIGKFTLKKFQARNVIARVNYKPGMYTLNSSVFETMQGRISGNGAVMQDYDKDLVVKGQASLKGINIKNLFTSFGNFGQTILQDRHLKGALTGNILVSCEWNNAMDINKEAILVESNIEISNGELLNFEPLRGLSKFISLTELNDIKFSTLKNQIFIRHQQIIIPQMDIKSSAFNISGNGIHNFDNHYTYRINVLLYEVLARKARQNKKENNEFGVVEEDGLGNTKIPLLIVGFNNEYTISYDTKGVKEIIKDSMRGQKNELKSIFKEEFGMFSRDSTINQKKKQTKFNVEWDEKPVDKKPLDSKPVKKKKKTFEEEEGYQIEFEK